MGPTKATYVLITVDNFYLCNYENRNDTNGKGFANIESGINRLLMGTFINELLLINIIPATIYIQYSSSLKGISWCIIISTAFLCFYVAESGFIDNQEAYYVFCISILLMEMHSQYSLYLTFCYI